MTRMLAARAVEDWKRSVAMVILYAYGYQLCAWPLLAWVTTLEVLANGNYVVGNCHAGPGNPLLIEIEPKTKKVVWTFDQFANFGNSVSNSQLLDVSGPRIR